MGRKRVDKFRGGIYHVIQRGNNREYIFRKKEDKIMLLDLFLKYRDVLGYLILGYVVMDNHYHIIIKTDEEMIDKVMHRINMDFAKAFNKNKKRSGHVFEKRYRGILVKDDSYLLSLLRYVHQNPTKAGICKGLNDYKWSSDTIYRRNETHGLVDINMILDMFSLDRRKALAEYARFMDDEGFESDKTFEEIEVIGDRELDIFRELNIRNKREPLDDILKRIAESEEDFGDIKIASRSRRLTPLKIRYIEECLNRNYKMEEIGKNIGISQSAVSRLLN